MDKAEDKCCHVAGRFESEVLLPLPLLVHGVKDGLPLGVVASPQVVYLLLHLGVQTRHPGKQQMGVSWCEEHYNDSSPRAVNGQRGFVKFHSGDLLKVSSGLKSIRKFGTHDHN